jgi:hypothetical protein
MLFMTVTPLHPPAQIHPDLGLGDLVVEADRCPGISPVALFAERARRVR